MKVHFIFSVQKDDQTAEVLVDTGGQHYTATASDPTLYAAIDMAIDKMETQLKKHKEKVQHHHNFETSNEGYLRQELAAQAEDLQQTEQVYQMKGSKK
jgi:ribosome-associated translation inhibitor RaiA